MAVERYVVTREGFAKLRARLKQIKEVDRPQNVRDIEEARAHGDLRENAEFHAAKDRQGFLEGELRSIEDKLSRAQVIDPASLAGDRVVFGATVTVLNVETDEEVTYKIVGEDEGDLKQGTISYKAPIARALIGREEGDEIVFNAPGGARTFEVVEIAFV
ncbi:MAG: transcription elongation factor GreA [Proteobacteria bacterium]|nr:MAG: transcription elongation factor GreA [Pseudomonadota bacterium]